MEFIIIASAHFLALLSPGPDFFLIVHRSIRFSWYNCIMLCLGIAIANGMYIGIAVLGLETVRSMTTLFTVVQYCGSAYLIYLGLRLIITPSTDLGGVAAGGDGLWRHTGNQFYVGFASALLNPKNIIFYLSLFSVMVAETTPLIIRLLYGVWMITVVFAWDCCVAFFLSNAVVKKRFSALLVPIEKSCGVLLVCCGVMLSLH